MADKNNRLDNILVARGFTETRSRAADAIRRGKVRVGGKLALKAGQSVAADAEIAFDDEAAGLASRGGLKLAAALDAFEIDVAGKICLDLGASTGGFIDVLLRRGAGQATAVDVGHGQLLGRLAGDPKVKNYEGLDVRRLTRAHLLRSPNLIVADLSFIGLEKALPNPLKMATTDAILIALIKPQFEAGPDHVGKGGIVRDKAVHSAVCERITAWLEGQGWPVAGLILSPIEGGSGNKEFLICARKNR